MSREHSGRMTHLKTLNRGESGFGYIGHAQREVGATTLTQGAVPRPAGGAVIRNFLPEISHFRNGCPFAVPIPRATDRI